MENLFYSLLSSRQLTFVNMVMGALLFIVLLFQFFGKTAGTTRQEDYRESEHCCADLILPFWPPCSATICVYCHAGAGEGQAPVLDAYLAVNAVQLIFNITAAVEIVGIQILKHKE